MPTPHGDHGLAFSMAEVRLLRRALLAAMKAGAAPERRGEPAPVDFWLLDRAIAEAEAERDRHRAFNLAELSRQRAALPGSAATYLSGLERAVAAYGHTPTAADLAALRSLADMPIGTAERTRRRTLLDRCTRLADAELDSRLAEKARTRGA
ncbi:hypothetical protein [Yinghuangia soli]|uniref:Uncharacterized protein n=1 Tax=Yinghuangia soli TaxID=2908204 RepID=A0AA41Q187_9ACTN|nr:hypothetical protein [Yinghuangia soli]MCF2529342.1 hypothetical protein [Yinghuangia soli]